MHIGKRSWWNGSVRTLCGLVIPASRSDQCVFVRVTCPACKAAKKAGATL